MFFNRVTAVSLFSMLTISVASAAEERDDVLDAVTTMSELQAAYTNVLTPAIAASNHFSDLFAGSADFTAFANASYTLWKAIPAYEESAAEVRALLAKHGRLEAWPENEALLQMVSESRVKTFGTIADAAKAVTDSTGRFTDQVHADERWQPTGYTLSEDNVIYIEAEGHWTMEKRVLPGTDWRGYREWNRQQRLDTSYPLGALVYRVRGDEGASSILAVDDYGIGLLHRTGELEFSVNDKSLDDNVGTITLEVYTFDRKALEAFQKALAP